MTSFNYAAALNSGNREIIEMMILPFLTAVPQYIRNIESAIFEHRHQDLYSHAHLLTGLAHRLNAEPVVRLSLSMETMGKNEKSEMAEELLPQLHGEIKSLMLVLSAAD
ncbi:Hpt domain-containing protein [Undibacterium squillarum]|uniref:HPt domain-containing protein n=1 Tax=Undibacterium squillarum TaxID=1131567 RepID=A0ABQ2XW59_9BURK|nr:Hpt domain-containing protein [Undibacterium squillarum]GGX36516.1 hypothetical protein GCM10010946_12910 [Undibacterium squillarum]